MSECGPTRLAVRGVRGNGWGELCDLPFANFPGSVPAGDLSLMDRSPSAQSVCAVARHVLRGGLCCWRRRFPAAPGQVRIFRRGDLFGSSASAPPPARAAAGGDRHRTDQDRARSCRSTRWATPGRSASRCATPPNSRSPNSTIPISSCWSRMTAARPRARSWPRSRRSTEGAQFIIGPLFAQSVQAAGQVARAQRYSGHRILDRFKRRRRAASFS